MYTYIVNKMYKCEFCRLLCLLIVYFYNIGYFIVTDKIKRSEEDTGTLTDGENGKFATCIKLLNEVILEKYTFNCSNRIKQWNL